MPNHERTGEEAGTEGPYVLAVPKLCHAERGADVGAVVADGQRQDASVWQPSAFVDALNRTRSPVEDPTVDGADPHVAIGTGQRGDRNVDQQWMRGRYLSAIVGEQPDLVRAEQDPAPAEDQRRRDRSLVGPLGAYLRQTTPIKHEQTFTRGAD